MLVFKTHVVTLSKYGYVAHVHHDHIWTGAGICNNPDESLCSYGLQMFSWLDQTGTFRANFDDKFIYFFLLKEGKIN